ncbi:hypothetical protein [Chitinophaga sp. RAB17]|uniref:hypothetical protein n=1 Tax=Chitinophaga sp. RAB17 TaxID=3233049 RepID=UPI003F8E3E61
MDITEDAEYVFYVNGNDKVQLSLGGKLLINAENAPGMFKASCITTLSKGRYPLRLELLHSTARLELTLIIYCSRSGIDNW